MTNLSRSSAVKTEAFTLIELLVVVLIIGILAAIALPMYTKAVEKTRAAEAMVIGKAISDSMERRALECGATNWDCRNYPGLFDVLDIEVPPVQCVGEGNDTPDKLSWCRATKYFNIWPYGEDVTIERVKTNAAREYLDYLYTIHIFTPSGAASCGDISLNGHITCEANGSVGESVCASIGKYVEGCSFYLK